MRIVEQESTVGVFHWSFFVTLGKKRVGDCGDFLGEGLAVVVGIARRAIGEIAVPVYLVAVGNAVAISILRSRQVVGRERRFLIEFEWRGVIRSAPIIARRESLLCRNRPMGEDVATLLRSLLCKVAAPCIKRTVSNLRFNAARERSLINMHYIGNGRNRPKYEQYCSNSSHAVSSPSARRGCSSQKATLPGVDRFISYCFFRGRRSPALPRARGGSYATASFICQSPGEAEAVVCVPVQRAVVVVPAVGRPRVDAADVPAAAA